tara:strand:+ start:476 stop:2158 length:1683 start_codon:yes stop_codon:yes gene_type:complete
MANLVQVAEELEYVPKEQLVQMSQNPDSRYPQYLVLSEIQRRTQMERMYNAQEASMNKPTTTVAEEVVADFAQPQPQGLAAMNVNGSANANAFSPEAAMSATPVQMAAIGGRTGFQNTGSTSRANLLASFDIDPTGMAPAEIEEALQQVYMMGPSRRTPATQAELGGASIGATELFPTVSPDAVPQSLISLVDSGTQTPLTTDISTSTDIPLPFDVAEITKAPDDTTVTTTTLPEIDEKGTIDPADIPEEDRNSLIDWAKENPAEAVLIGLDAAALALLVAPVPFARVGAGILKGLSWIGRGLRGGYQAKKARLLQNIGSRTQAKAAEKGLDGKKLITQGSGSSKNLPTPPGYWESWGRTGLKNMRLKQRLIAAGVAVPTSLMLYNQMTDDEVIKSQKKDKDGHEKKDIIDTAGEYDPNLGKEVKSYLDQADGLDIAKLGGIIMGARNMTELGQGITSLAGDIQTRRASAKSEERLEALSRVQGAYYQAQIDNMEPEQLQAQMTNVAKMYKLAIEEADKSGASNLLEHWEQLNKRLSELQGTEYKTTKERHQQTVDKQLR